MKKIILLFVGIVISISVQSQALWDSSKPDNNFTIGIRAGMNMANSDEDQATSIRTCFHAGITIDYNIIKSFSLSSGVYYVGKGFRGNYPEISLAHASKATASNLSANYIQIPLFASWRIEAVSGVQFHINIGPYYAYGISGNAVYQPYDMTFDRFYDQDTFGASGFWEHNDYGLCFGAYVLIGKFIAGASYEWGINDVAKVYGSFHNRNVSISVGYNF